MNPWELVSWIGAMAVSVLIVTVSVVLVVSMFKAMRQPKKESATTLLKGGGS